MSTKFFLSNICVAIIVLLFGSCEGQNSTPTGNNSSSNGSGKSGSLSRFAVVDQYLYTVDSRTLHVFDLTDGKARFLSQTDVGFNIETIFARGSVLFLGASDGVHIYDISSKESPMFLSLYTHIFSCDPVVADENFAYATLSTSRAACARGVNQMDVIDISNLRQPRRVTSLLLTNPLGLGLMENRLILCNNGIELYDVTNKSNIRRVSQYKTSNAFDVIPFGNTFAAVTSGGFENFEIRNDSLVKIGFLNYR